MQIFKDYIRFFQPAKVAMIGVGAAIGYFLAERNPNTFSWIIFFHLLWGVCLAATGSLIFNQVWEWKSDAAMERTKHRMIPSQKISATSGFFWGLFFTIIGHVWLWFYVNPLACILTLAVGVDYVLLYTPLKKWSWWNTPVGAISGAILPMVGWAARTDHLSEGAWFLFAVLFFWQFPHSYALYYLYKEDYAKGGYKMLPVSSPNSPWSAFQTTMSAVLLVPLTLLPYAKGYVGPLYAIGCLILGVLLLKASIRFYLNPIEKKARFLFRSTLIYLPFMLVLAFIDRLIF